MEKANLAWALPVPRANREVLQQGKALSSYCTRSDKPAANDLAVIKPAAIRIWLRTHESTA
jgi:hypothetical protein